MDTFVKKIGIIGGGFCGTMVLANLIRNTLFPLEIILYDKDDTFAQGIAYRTGCPNHLLNVPAIKMGAFFDDEGGFLSWLQNNQSWRGLHSSFSEIIVTADSFMPRMIYAAYLRHILDESIKIALQKKCSIIFSSEEVVNCFLQKDASWLLTTNQQKVNKHNFVVLAVGNFKADRLESDIIQVGSSKRYIDDFWSTRNQQYLSKQDFSAFPADTIIGIVGSGLTMVDIVLELEHRKYSGKILCLSRHGVLPKPHRLVKPYISNVFDPLNSPRNALELYQLINREIDKIELEGKNWRLVFDGLRPITNQIWKRLPYEEQRLFLNNFLSWWNVLRHRIPIECYDFIYNLIEKKRLKLEAGQLIRIQNEDNNDLIMCYKQKAADDIICTNVYMIINATGFSYKLSNAKQPLLKQLYNTGIIEDTPLGCGVKSDGKYKIQDSLYVLGPILFGERLETTAVPELRQQAYDVASLLLK